MKKKTIEQIEYLGLPKTSRKKNVRFVGRTAIKNVAHEKHFFLEVYRNDNASRKVPVVRIVVTRKDFGTYFPAEGRWSRANIERDEYARNLIWELTWEDGIADYRTRQEQNILHSPDDMERVKRFFKDIKIWNDKNWWEYIEKAEYSIAQEERIERRDREYKKRQQALQDRKENTPELPEQEILSWADKTLFKQQHFLYYRKMGRRAVVCCSACGGVSEGSWKAGDTYESQFEKHISEPRDRYTGFCPMCSAVGTYKPQGKAKSSHHVLTHTFKADRYKATGAVIRYILLMKRWELEQSVNDKGGLDMVGAREVLEGLEIARTYIHDGKTQTDFQKSSCIDGKKFWDDCNMHGINSITVGDAVLYPGFSESLAGTCLQYSAIELYAGAAGGEVNASRYMERYLAAPQIEMLVKLRLYGVVKKLLNYEYGCIVNDRTDRPDEFLGIRKEKLKMLMESRGDTELLRILQMEKRMEQRWTDEQITALAEIMAAPGDIELGCRIMTLQKVLNLIEKYAGCGYGTECSRAADRLRATATMYFDYLHMREQGGYDLNNTVYQRPRNLEAAHMKMVEELNKEEMDKRKQYVAERFPLIRKNYRKLRNRFLYEDEEFIIRPARSAEEIIQEGRILHHCVGGDSYLRGHNEQKRIILMLRPREAPEIPYITVEINASDGRIVQWYGAHDKKPDKARMLKWLDAYETRLKCSIREGIGNTGTECLSAGA